MKENLWWSYCGLEPALLGELARPNPFMGLHLIASPHERVATDILMGIVQHYAHYPHDAPELDYRHVRTYRLSSLSSSSPAPTGNAYHYPKSKDPKSLVNSWLQRSGRQVFVLHGMEPEIIDPAITSAMVGTRVYASVPAAGIVQAINYCVNCFPVEERPSRLVDVISSLSTVVAPHPSSPNMPPSHDLVVFNDDLVDRMIDAGLSGWRAVLKSAIVN